MLYVNKFYEDEQDVMVTIIIPLSHDPHLRKV